MKVSFVPKRLWAGEPYGYVEAAWIEIPAPQKIASTSKTPSI
jgi:hypothetical protein